MTLKECILNTKRQHPDWGYKRIAKVVNCSYNLVKYHLSSTARQQFLDRQRRQRTNNPCLQKLQRFIFEVIQSRKKRFNRVIRTSRPKPYNKTLPSDISARQLFQELQQSPTCYLTGRRIDLYDTKSYNFDHIVPLSKGGKNNRTNLGLACRQANAAKSDMTLHEFLMFCREVLQYHGYKVQQPT